LDLGEFQVKLLEKVEELTLYTLAQDEQIEALQRQNAELEARLAALEEKLAGGE
jgi:cell division protein FtsB